MRRRHKNLIKKVIIGISVLLVLLVLLVSVKGSSFKPISPTSHVRINSFSTNLFRIPLFSIMGEKIVSPGEQVNYSISLQAIGDYDGDYSDGSYMVRYGNWALIDKNNNILDQGDWDEISNEYSKNVSIIAPNKLGDYAIIVVITENTANYSNDEWVWNGEVLNNKEAFKFKVSAPTPINTPSPKSIMGWLSQFWSWIKSLFGI